MLSPERSYQIKKLRSTLELYILYYNAFLTLAIVIQPQLGAHDPFIITTIIEYVIKNYGFIVTMVVRVLASRSSGLGYRIRMVFVDFLFYFVNTCKYSLCNLCDKIFSKEFEFNTSGHVFILSYFSYLVFLAYKINPKTHILATSLVVWSVYLIYVVNTIIFYHTKGECFVSVILATISSYTHLAIILKLKLV